MTIGRVLTPGPVRKREIGTLLKDVIKVIMKAEIIPTLILGSTTKKKLFSGLAPRLCAASSTETGKFTRLARVDRTTYGNTIAVWPINKVVWTEKTFKRTKNLSNASPATIPGIITGKVVANSTKRLPLKSYLAVTYATGTPSNKERKEEYNANCRLKTKLFWNMGMAITFLNHDKVKPVGGNLNVEDGSKEAKKITKNGPSRIIKAITKEKISHLLIFILCSLPECLSFLINNSQLALSKA